MHRGWVKLWRKIEDSPVWSMPPLHRSVWLWILVKVDHKTGSITTTLDHIAEGVAYYEWEVERIPDRKTILRILRRFEEEKMIIRESHKRGTKISVENWSIYNPKENDNATAVPYSVPYQVPYQVPQQEQEVLPKKESKPVPQSLPVVVPAGKRDVSEGGNGRAGETDPPPQRDLSHPESNALYRRFNALVGPLSMQTHYILKLQLLRATGKLTDEQMFEIIMNAGKKIQAARDKDSYLLTILKNEIEHPGGGGRSNFNCPDHGPMTRENWGGKVVYQCRKVIASGIRCKSNHKTEQKWTDQPQKWEPQNH